MRVTDRGESAESAEPPPGLRRQGGNDHPDVSRIAAGDVAPAEA